MHFSPCKMICYDTLMLPVHGSFFHFSKLLSLSGTLCKNRLTNLVYWFLFFRSRVVERDERFRLSLFLIMRNSLTPEDNDPYIEYILQAINAKIEPVYLTIEAEANSSYNDCVGIVERKVKTSGGRAILGWQIWRLPFLIEAEFHCVWQTPRGELKDITPKQSNDIRILFVEDEDLKYEGRQINTVRVNLTYNKLVDDFIAISNAIFFVTNKGSLAYQHGLITLQGEEADMYSYLKRLERITLDMLWKNLTRDSLCGCHSEKGFQDCHGKNLYPTLLAMQV